MDKTAVTMQSDGEQRQGIVRVECNDKGLQVAGRAAEMIMRLASLADQINREVKGTITLHFYLDDVQIERRYCEDPP